MKALINRIIPFSNVDGPGNRCAIFFQGCPLHCAYCHNPETWRICDHCGQCVAGCPAGALTLRAGKVVWEESRCVGCDQCIHVCPHHASCKVSELTPEALLDRVAETFPFIQGITVSGGECMLYADFLTEFFRLVKAAGKTCLIDSNGMIDFRQYPELLQLCDGVMLDMKAIDDNFHRQLTGASNRQVLDNLTLLLEAGKLEEVRTVLLPEFSEQNQKTVRGVNERLQGKIRYKLLRYRPFGVCEEGLRFCGRTITPLEEAQRLAQAESDRGFHNCVVI